MFYNNIIYLLVVILLFSASTVPETPQLPPLWSLALFAAKLFAFREVCRALFRPFRATSPPRYFAAEQRLSILAIVMVAVDIYLLDCQYYIARLPFVGLLPSLVDGVGMAVFFFYLAVMWAEAVDAYGVVFGRRYSRGRFVLNSLKANVPVVLPWFLLSLLSDLLRWLPISWLGRFLDTAWGEWAVLMLFFLVLAVFFPVIVTRMWNCTPLPSGETRQRIERFCRRQGVRYADILLWPLFEGQVLTAGVLGIVGRYRYLLVTPALLHTVTPEEVEAVMAHELGHVKYRHMYLYLFLFLGFGLLSQVVSYPALSLLLDSDLFYWFVDIADKEPNSALTLVTTVSMMGLLVVYFRFVFGFFMRNFERQADLHAWEVMGSGRPLASVLEKIAVLSGDIRDLPSWHHFGIGQRVAFLERCDRDPRAAAGHHRKVRAALFAYCAVLALAGALLFQMPSDLLEGAPREKFAAAVLQQRIEQEPQNYVWRLLLADLEQSRHRYAEAIAAYEEARRLAPANADIMNNLAWLYLTAEDPRFRDYDMALILAREAARLKAAGYIYDTLALAYWENGYPELAIKAEERALALDPANAVYYRQQLAKFRQGEEE